MSFLFLYLAVYGGMQAYWLLKLHRAYHPLGWVWLPLLAWAACMIAGPILVHGLERRGPLPLARGLALLVFSWMAVSLWFLAIGAAADLWNGLASLAGTAWTPARQAILPPRLLPPLALTLILGAMTWGLAEARRLRVVEQHIVSRRLPAGSRPLRLAQVTDLHLGLTASEGRLATVLACLRDLQPDLVVSTGDLVDAGDDRTAGLADHWRDLQPPLGKFAVVGNHEVYPGLTRTLPLLERAGFRVLRGESVAVQPWLCLAGVDDLGHGDATTAQADEATALPPRSPTGPFTVLLKHQPRLAAAAAATVRFDLQLSGHTHGGQVAPFGWVVALFYAYGPGLHRLADGAHLYVSHGSGTWGPPFRLFAPPEVTLFTLEPERGPGGGG